MSLLQQQSYSLSSQIFFFFNYNKFDIFKIKISIVPTFFFFLGELYRHLEHGISNVELNIRSLMNNDSPY